MTAPDQACIDIKKTLANQAPSTDDPEPSFGKAGAAQGVQENGIGPVVGHGHGI